MIDQTIHIESQGHESDVTDELLTEICEENGLCDSNGLESDHGYFTDGEGLQWYWEVDSKSWDDEEYPEYQSFCEVVKGELEVA